jgi:hypothetical protein
MKKVYRSVQVSHLVSATWGCIRGQKVAEVHTNMTGQAPTLPYATVILPSLQPHHQCLVAGHQMASFRLTCNPSIPGQCHSPVDHVNLGQYCTKRCHSQSVIGCCALTADSLLSCWCCPAAGCRFRSPGQVAFLARCVRRFDPVTDMVLPEAAALCHLIIQVCL